ncbi:hypothetical protein NPX13_g2255 [Xylaria arbuscula]|uniref:Uncharacterized protein n=1 Tax=Xylaria arbuscula TaxID=114810 RepID=A0A9W8NKJ6_9PEZI|nr:hypothetical protein NPX13_g2255 [Xylaria arbuscula]
MECDTQRQADLITLVVNEYRKLARGPYGAKDALRVAKQADDHSIDGILLKKGDAVWRAYYAAKKATKLKHGFSGQAELTQLFNELNTKSIETQRAFAEQLASAMGSDSQPSVESNAVSDVANGVKRRRTAEGCTTPTAPLNKIVTTHHIIPEHHTPERLPDNSASLKDVYVGAPLDPAKDLFYDQFWDAIERILSTENPDIWVADISMIFQKGFVREHFGCQMEIGITPEKVAEFALEYFGVKVEVKDGVRYVRYPGGAIIEPDTSIKLRVCARDLSRIFKGELYEAACTSPVYQSEEKKRLSHTNGVSMTISNQAKEGGKITVFMGEWRAVRIKQQFYG